MSLISKREIQHLAIIIDGLLANSWATEHYEHHTAIAATGSQTMFFGLKEFPSYAY